MPRFRGYGKGDLLIRIGIAIPQKTSKRERELLEELAKESDEEVSKGHRFPF
jgi:molecular chaperone DnaJ